MLNQVFHKRLSIQEKNSKVSSPSSSLPILGNKVLIKQGINTRFIEIKANTDSSTIMIMTRVWFIMFKKIQI